ncbi:uncharacterized protein AB675_5049 [Cyphellophora attinorum]|uniref:NUDE domain-containing protein n=1 Tax=Cyphellophora attinorum TaxID=1664694 RepID=A0A0N1H3E9_9EURO|nr:uncharacterized protein AB675_5049 [Phialophora attinorum]KPI39397.1 hypothetical protein AB675_5049 [Phialophora attinorum]
MPLDDDLVSSSPGPGHTLEENLRYYKKQYETLESELADFQASSKELEAELEKDIEASEKRERQLKDKASNLQYEVDEWKAKHKQAKSEAASAQSTLQKEITELRDTNRTLQLRLRDTEVANDDYERQQRNTESSLEDMESKYNQTLERSVMLEEEMRVGEQEREALRIEAQRLKDELSDINIETEIVKEKLAKAEAVIARRHHLTIDPVASSASPRSELSPTTTDTSFDTPPAKTASSSAVSEAPTPPSPPVSDKSAALPKPKPHGFATPSIPRSRPSLNGNLPTPRQSAFSAVKPNASGAAHIRGSSVQVPAIQRTVPSSTHARQSLGRAGGIPQRSSLPQSQSILHLRNLRNKMQNLEARVHTARSKLPGPVNTPPKASPRSGSAMGNHAIPSSVTVRSRKRAGGSTISGVTSLADSDDTPSAPRTKPSRQSLTSQYARDMPPPTPTHSTFGRSALNDMPAPTSRPSSRGGPQTSSQQPSRPDSRTSTHNRHSFIASHSRPGSRASISNLRGLGNGASYVPNASTDRVRPKSALSSHGPVGYDGAFDADSSSMHNGGDPDDSIMEEAEPDADPLTTPTPRRTSFLIKPSSRTSDIGLSAIPSPVKGSRTSIGGVGAGGRVPSNSISGKRSESAQGQYAAATAASASRRSVAGKRSSLIRPPSRAAASARKEKETEKENSAYDVNETF